LGIKQKTINDLPMPSMLPSISVRRAFGFGVNLHRFRHAAGNLWSIQDPVNVTGVKDLLRQASFDRTTEKPYIMGQSRLAGRALAEANRYREEAGLRRNQRLPRQSVYSNNASKGCRRMAPAGRHPPAPPDPGDDDFEVPPDEGGIFSTDIDSFDFKIRKPDQVVKSMMTKLEKHGKGIILMHDFQHATAEALPELIRQLKAGAIRLRSLFHIRGHDPSYDGRSAMSGRDLHRALRTPQPVVSYR
jgi:hypothetical protein